MTDRELMQQALEALEADEHDMVTDKEGHMIFRKEAAITALRERLAQPEQTVPSDHSNSHQPAQSPLDRMAENARELGLDYEPVNTIANSEAIPEQISEPVAHSIVAGALFDFMGWLTTRPERLVLSSTDNAGSAADAIKDFAQMRSLSINDAQVQEWQEHLTTPPRREWVGLTQSEIAEILCDDRWQGRPEYMLLQMQAKLKEKNNAD